jgi:hypothetical protein
MPTLPKNSILLAIDPTSRGFAFAVLEAPAYLVDWGSKKAASSNILQKVDELVSRYQPDVLVLEDLGADGARRRKRARREIGSIERRALKRGVRIERVSRLAVLDAIAPEKSKYEVALRLAEIFPVLANRLPRKRKTWTPEEARMSVFDALGIAAATVGQARCPRATRSMCASRYRERSHGPSAGRRRSNKLGRSVALKC